MSRKKTTQTLAHVDFFSEVRKRMLQHGVSQKELAERLGVSQAAVSRTLTASQNPSVQLMSEIAAALGYKITIVWDREK